MLGLVHAVLEYNQLDVNQGFEGFDTSQSGKIGEQEFKEVTHSLVFGLSESEFKTLFAVLDVNRDGIIDLSDWQKALSRGAATSDVAAGQIQEETSTQMALTKEVEPESLVPEHTISQTSQPDLAESEGVDRAPEPTVETEVQPPVETKVQQPLADEQGAVSQSVSQAPAHENSDSSTGLKAVSLEGGTGSANGQNEIHQSEVNAVTEPCDEKATISAASDDSSAPNVSSRYPEAVESEPVPPADSSRHATDQRDTIVSETAAVPVPVPGPPDGTPGPAGPLLATEAGSLNQSTVEQIVALSTALDQARREQMRAKEALAKEQGLVRHIKTVAGKMLMERDKQRRVLEEQVRSLMAQLKAQGV